MPSQTSAAVAAREEAEVQSLPKTMKAVRIHGYGGPEMLEFEEVACPRPAAGDVLVRVYAAGVNPVDWKVREGHLKDFLKHRLPLVPGWDFSGVVVAAGDGATRFRKGDEVYSRPISPATGPTPSISSRGRPRWRESPSRWTTSRRRPSRWPA